MPRWAVVIASDSAENLRLSVTSLLCAHPAMEPKDILVVSRALTQDRQVGILRDVGFLLDPTEEFSFARRINLGLNVMKGKDVVVMGDDVEVITRNAFDILAETATIRILSPSIRGRVGPPWQKEGQDHPEVPFISFICVYLSKMALEIVGSLEERFPGYGYEDTDYCLRARKAGLAIGVDGRVLVEHNIRIPSAFVGTYGAKLSPMEEVARQAFISKWMGV